MADPRFFENHGPFTLADLVLAAGGALAGACDAGRLFRDVAPLAAAGPDDVAFLENRKYLLDFESSNAGACIVLSALAGRAPNGMALILSDQPYKSYARVAQKFYPVRAVQPGLSSSAIIDPSARLGAGVYVAPGAVIETGVEIGARSYIGANTVITRQVKIGADAWIGSNVSISCALIGDRVTLHPGVRIGQDGFGFAPDPAGFVKVPQLGRVIIQDDCDIGANTAIDRGSGPDTVIGEGTWIDNLVQIGHNVRIGRRCIIAAQAGISGSTELGDYVQIGGQGGLAGHLKIGDAAQITAQSGLMRDVPAGERVAGTPALPAKQHFRTFAAMSKLGKFKGDANG